MNKDFEITNYQIVLKSPIPEGWLKALEYYNRPSRTDFVAFEVSRMRNLTAKRKEGEFDMEMSIEAITEELRDYPEDVVQSVCRSWARTNIFFPVLKELIDKCESHMILRRALLSKGKENKYLEHRKTSKKEEEWKKPTETEIKKVSSIMSPCDRIIHASADLAESAVILTEIGL